MTLLATPNCSTRRSIRVGRIWARRVLVERGVDVFGDEERELFTAG